MDKDMLVAGGAVIGLAVLMLAIAVYIGESPSRQMAPAAAPAVAAQSAPEKPEK